jgi:hypothetical protein
MDHSKLSLVHELRYIGGILNLAKESFDLFEYLEFPQTEAEKKYLENAQCFITIKDALWCNCCVDLAKLYSKKKIDRINKYNGGEIFNISSLLSALKEGKYVLSDIDYNAIELRINEINKNKDSIELLIRLRNKEYAHTEIHDLPKVDFQDIFLKVKYLLDMGIEIFNFLWFQVLGRKTAGIVFTQFDTNKFDIIRKLASSK